MHTILKLFTRESLFDACAAMLRHLHIEFNEVTRTPVTFESLYPNQLSKSLREILLKVDKTYFIGTIDEASLSGNSSRQDQNDVTTLAKEERYVGMMVFAIDINPDKNITRTELATLTRGFNRIASAQPVVLFIRQGACLSLSTCERSEYTQQWRDGEKLGKVSLLRDIDCNHPHRGHIDILESIGDKVYPSFEELYKHWMEVFSSELLTKRFYTELSEWYAWATKVIRFPNALDDDKDDAKYNTESGIRLVTRLIFVWFLKQKGLVPEEFFDEKSLRQILRDFDPTQKEHSLFGYMSKDSKYYKAILQNLFFAMLNTPLTEGNDFSRGFRKYDADGKASGSNRGDHHLMRYKKYFVNPDEFLSLANKVPFLNGGLFECLDDVEKKFYLDGFSENEKVSKSLCVPNYLFFGEQEDIDLSEWYDDNQKRRMKVRGIIDILKSYQFTIEENTPYEQEVSLDPELLGKVFENLLASYNPETKKTARKSTGSYYTPREIVQYMVNESLVAYLKETVDKDLEEQYRQLLDYTEKEVELTLEQKHLIILALYQCKVLDPACGSGAFPMGILQQMVHLLTELDPENIIWKHLIEEQSKKELADSLNNYSQEERDEVQADINRSFDLSQNAPDYARKLYLIENCIYGVDIQTTAIQISKLRCFISLVVDQKVNDNPVDNYGIRPLPNLEARFVAANTIIGINKNLSLANTDEVMEIKSKLKEANHRIFSAKTMRTKRKWKDAIIDYRKELCEALEKTGFITHDEAILVSSWDMFNQNKTSSFFDREWMFGVTDGYNIVIGNPPYIKEYTNKAAFDGFRETSPYYMGKMDLWYGFACHGIDFLKPNGVLCFIAQNNWTTSAGAKKMRSKVINDCQILQMLDFNTYMIFESADIQTMIMLFRRNNEIDNYQFDYRAITQGNEKKDMFALLTAQQRNTRYLNPTIIRKLLKDKLLTFSKDEQLFDVLLKNKVFLRDDEIAQGIVPNPDVVNSRNIKHITDPTIQVGEGVFVVDKEKFSNCTGSEKKYIKPLYEPFQMQRYHLSQINEKCLLYITKSNWENDAPTLLTHLSRFKNIMLQRRENQNGRIDFMHLHWPRDEEFFKDGAKILSKRKCVESPVFVYYESQAYVMMSVNVIKTSRWNMKFLTGVLNSKLVAFWLRHKGKMQGNNYQVDKEPLMGIPLPVVNNLQQQPIISIVDQILEAKNSNPETDTTGLEYNIDRLVCHLYNLTYDEVLIIYENEKPPFSREQYENENE